jgi:myo-inositol 2-dehydrogenase / D-chiro-inositol 1-dehydrogenase
MSTLRYCVVGAGSWSMAMHLPTLQKLCAGNDVEIAGVCDLDEEKARVYAAAFGTAKVFTDLEAMIAEVDPHGLAILVPTGASARVISHVAKLGKPFLAEKPPASSSDEHRRLIEEVGDLVHVVAYNRRHSPYIAKARELLAGQKLQSVACHFSRSRRHDPDFSTTAVHAIDTLRCLGGDWASMRLEVRRVGPALNFFIDGWTTAGARLDLHITPDTGSGEEHYFARSAERNVFVVFPHWSLADYPGYLEVRHEEIQCERFGPAELGLDAADNALMAGIYGEHLALVRALRGEEAAESTLAATLQTQVIREELKKAIDAGATTSVTEVSF